MPQSVNIKECKELVIDIFKVGLTPMVSGSPGLAKSAMFRQIAEEFKLFLIDVRLAQADITDLNGYPFIDKEKGVSSYIPFDTFPTEDTPIPDGYRGFLLLMDEISSAPLAVQAASYKVILDHEVGQKKLHPKCKVAAAGNLMTDKAIVNRMGTAMQSRLIHLQVHADIDTWTEWAIPAGIDYRIIAFLQFRTDLLHAFNPNHNDVTFPCPRTYEFLSKLIIKWEHIGPNKLPLIAGCIGEGTAVEFKGFVDYFDKLPTKEAILASPDTVNIDKSDPGMLYALSGLVTGMVNIDNITNILIFINRMPVEFQIITMRNVFQISDELLYHKEVVAWKLSNISQLVD